MRRSIGLWQTVGFAVTSLAGTLLHFLYDWTGGALWAAPFSGVNESTWEHVKLLFWPMLAVSAVQCFFFKDRRDFWDVKLKGTLLGLILIPVLFYTYNGVIGRSPDWVNIAIFFIAAAAVYIREARRFTREAGPHPSPKVAAGVLCAIALLFVIFTFAPPRLGVFQDPLTGGYGLAG